jgi:mRNA-degrading endonuclease RelE of RelBE toxin-antitoxin system
MNYKVVIEPRAILDIQDAVDYYNMKSKGLGIHIYETLEEHFKILVNHPSFQIRYKDYHGLPVKKYPFILFYYIDENVKTVYILSVFNTYINTTKYPK